MTMGRGRKGGRGGGGAQHSSGGSRRADNRGHTSASIGRNANSRHAVCNNAGISMSYTPTTSANDAWSRGIFDEDGEDDGEEITVGGDNSTVAVGRTGNGHANGRSAQRQRHRNHGMQASGNTSGNRPTGGAANEIPPPPFSVPPGWVWDGDRMYKLDPKLSRVRVAQDDSWDTESSSVTSVRSLPSSSSAKGTQGKGSMAKGLGQSTSSKRLLPSAAPPQPPQPVPPSAFRCTPAAPPAAFLNGGTATLTHGMMPRSCPPSSTAATGYKRARLQSHADSFKFHSRDNLVTQTSDTEGLIASIARSVSDIAKDDSTGALLWLQGSSERQLDPLVLDLGGRSRHCDHNVQASTSTSESRMQTLGSIPDITKYPYGSNYDNVVLSYAPPMARVMQQRVEDPGLDTRAVRVVGFADTRNVVPPTLRGLAVVGSFPIGTTSCEYDPVTGLPVFEPASWHSTRLKPNKHWTRKEPALATTLDHFFRFTTEGNVCTDDVASADFECVLSVVRHETDGGDFKLDRFVLSPTSMDAVSCPRFEQPADPDKGNFRHTEMCVNPETGYCWFGFRSGSVQVIDTLHMLKVRHGAAGRYRPLVAPTQEYTSAAVTNLVSVGTSDVIVAYSDGKLLRLHNPPYSRPAEVVMEYVGHVNEGNMQTRVCVDVASGLIAARGIDGHIRIWHLDSPFPLNSAWHRVRRVGPSRQGEDGEGDDYENPPSLLEGGETLQHLQRRLIAASTRPISGYNSNKDHRQSAFEDLAYRTLDDNGRSSIATALDMPLSQLHTRSVTCMAFVHPSWVADRDAQWQHTREFAAGHAVPNTRYKAGELPALCVGVTTNDGPRLLYFEHVGSLPPV